MPDAAIGTKTDEPIMRVPFSIQAVPRAVIDDQGATTLKDVLRNVAGVMTGGYYESWDYFRIRGFDATGFTFLDGLQIDPLWWFQEEPFGLERDVPLYAFNVWTKYEIQDGPLKGLGFGAGGRYYTDQAGDLPNTFELPAYGLLDLAAYYTRGPMRLQVNVNNVLDKRYFPTAFSREYVLPGEPLSVIASLTWRYDAK